MKMIKWGFAPADYTDPECFFDLVKTQNGLLSYFRPLNDMIWVALGVDGDTTQKYVVWSVKTDDNCRFNNYYRLQLYKTLL